MSRHQNPLSNIPTFIPRDWESFQAWSDTFVPELKTCLDMAGIKEQDYELFSKQTYPMIATSRLALSMLDRAIDEVLDYRNSVIKAADTTTVQPPDFSGLITALSALKPVPGNFIGQVEDFAADVRNGDGYNDGIGHRLRIIPQPKAAPDFLHEKPTITKTEKIANQVFASWIKGPNDAVIFQYREDEEELQREAGTGFNSPSAVAVPVLDKPRVIHLRARYIKSGKPVGEWSAELRLTI